MVSTIIDYRVTPVAHGVFPGGYAFPIESVYAVYSDHGQPSGRYAEVGYVAKTLPGRGRQVEWVVKNKSGELWFSYGKTRAEAILGAARDGIIP